MLHWKVKVTQSCLTLCYLMDYTVHGILQARILEWVAFPFSRGSSQPRNRTRVSGIAGRFFTNWGIREALGSPLCVSCSVMSDSLWPHGLQPARLLHPWDFPGKYTGVGCHGLLQGISLTQGWNPCLLIGRRILYHGASWEVPLVVGSNGQ